MIQMRGGANKIIMKKTKEPRRLPFQEEDVRHLYELALEHFCDEPNGGCATCTRIKARMEKFMGEEDVKAITRTIKKNGYCNKLACKVQPNVVVCMYAKMQKALGLTEK